MRRRGPRGRQMKRNVNQGTFFDRGWRCCWKDTSQSCVPHPTRHHTPEEQGWHLGFPLLRPYLPLVWAVAFPPACFPRSLIQAPTSLFQAYNSWSKDRRKQKTFRCHFLTWTKVLDHSHQLKPLELQPNSSLRLFDTTLRIPDRCSVRKDATN